MTVLIFRHEEWDVVTSSWTAGARTDRPGVGVIVCYEWGADGLSLLSGAVSTRRVTLQMTMAQFIERVSGQTVVDLRSG